MATTVEVFQYLRSQGGWVVYGDDLAAAIYDEGIKPITQKEFDDAKAIVDAEIEAAETAKEAKKAALLDRLGITVDEAKLLLG